MCALDASSFRSKGMLMVTGCGSHGVASGWAVSSTSVAGVVHSLRAAIIQTCLEGGRVGNCQLHSYSLGFWREVAKWLGTGKEEAHLLTTGYEGGRERRQRAYLRCLSCILMCAGGRVASLWRAMIGVEQNALRIRQRAVFCWSCSLWARVFCLVHQISVPKSDLERTHARYSERVVEGDTPVSCLTRLQRALKDLDAAISFNFTWCKNKSLQSNCIPIHLTMSFLPSFIPGITEVPLGSMMLVSAEWVSL
jgi:hypothetical protein